MNTINYLKCIFCKNRNISIFDIKGNKLSINGLNHDILYAFLQNTTIKSIKTVNNDYILILNECMEF